MSNANDKKRRERDDFSWDQPQTGIFQGLKNWWRDYKFNRQIIAEERRALKEIQAAQKPKRPDSPGSYADFENSVNDGRVVKLAEATKPEQLSFFQQLRLDRQIRKEILAERSKTATTLEERSVVKPNRLAGSQFGVGGDKEAIGDDGGPKNRVLKMVIQAVSKKLLAARIPQWALSTLPVIMFFAWAIVPGMTESEDRFAATTKKLQTQLPEFVRNRQWKESELTVYLILSSRLTQIDDVFAYYDTLIGLNEPAKALTFLVSQEVTQKDFDRGNFLYFFATKILETKSLSSSLLQQVVAKLEEALKNRLSPGNEIKARQLLSRIMASQGQLQLAYKILEPIQSKSVEVASEVLWLRWNVSETNSIIDLQSNCRRLLDEIDAKIANTEKLDDSLIGSRARLLMMMGQEQNLRSWLAAQPQLSKEDKSRWSQSIDQLSLVAEFKRTPLREDYVWQKLIPLLESDPENIMWNRIATTLWSAPKSAKNAEAFDWVKTKLDSGKASIDFLKLAANAAHMQARWELLRPIYLKIVEQDPNDVPSLNNLAAILYKFTPYDYETAMKRIDQAIAKSPNNLGILETKGQILARMGKLDESKVILEKCLPLFPNEWNIHNTLAQIYDIEGQKARAQAHRERLAVLKKPDNAPLVDLISLVEAPKK